MFFLQNKLEDISKFKSYDKDNKKRPDASKKLMGCTKS